MATRTLHLEHIAAIEDRIVAGGPTLDAEGLPNGSVVIAEFPDLAAAEAFIATDPYTEAGLFERVIVREWRQVAPAVT